MAETRIIEADLTWTGDGFARGVQVAVGDDGRIEQVGALGVPPTERLEKRALLPGMVSAHSHAFQIGLRGMGERFPGGAGSFWTWRDAMYGLVELMDAKRLRRLCLRAFREMLSQGITTTGEFHYLRHDVSRAGFAFDEVILDAAAEAGVRLCLLCSHYSQGGFGKPLLGGQVRFASGDVEAYWKQLDHLSTRIDAHTQSLGASVHSLRAATLEELALVHTESKRRGMVFHIHIEEQRREIQQCIDAHDAAPMALLCERLEIDERFTAVHCTHTDPTEMERFIEMGGRVCICPLTEANLGDGVADVPGILGSEGRICIGTDSNARICMAEELRWLEYVQRLSGEERGVVTDDAGRLAPALIRVGATEGAAALGVESGAIEAGLHADFFTLDLDHPTLAECDDESLAEAWLLGSDGGAVAETCVGGRWVWRRGESP
ncbi:MAG: formimidoylglutamate deiminase [Phycisphaeraceae bacterium]|nr:MAG: formimidoylglutamate deiminase [Phycisphaeraceae bacterium]